MSSSIWTRCGRGSSCLRLALEPRRVVEAQHVISTRKLTDSDEDQELLEALLDQAKPPPGEDTEGLHFLLFTPFRYPPLRHGSRFGTRAERGIWYGGEGIRACLAEAAFYRLVFLEGTAADLSPIFNELTSFRADVRSDRAVDLTAPPFDAYVERLSSPTSYEESQRLGQAMREEGVELCRYRSARDPQGGANVAVFSPAAFVKKRPRSFDTWTCVTTWEGVELSKRDLSRRRKVSMRFPRSVFLVKGELPNPAS